MLKLIILRGLSKFKLKIKKNNPGSVNLLTSNISINDNFISSFSKMIIKIWKTVGFEALVWILGLLYLALIYSPGETHFTICPLANLGLDFCPGCGLGHSISYLFRGDFTSSFHSHPLGIFALIIIVSRIISLIKINRRRYA
jgi:hypothetical protein